MSGGLPALVEPFGCVERGVRFQARIPLAGLPRLREALAGDDGDATVDLAFGRDAEGHATLTGRVQAALALRCERCLEPLTLDVDAPLALGLVETDAEAARLPAELDPLVVEGGLSLAEVVEDELILAVPIVPRHGEGTCPSRLAERYRPGPEAPREESPFAVLERLKRQD
jgi:uncharacterized protein